MRRDRSGCRVVVVVVSGKGNNVVVAVVGGDVEECSGDHKELLEDGNCGVEI